MAVVAVAVLVLALAGAFAVLQPTSRPAHRPPSLLGAPQSWVIAFDDEFTGSSLDGSKWQANRNEKVGPQRPFNPTLEDAWFSPANVTVGNGTLSLSVRHEPKTVNDRRYPLSSGMAQTAPGYAVGPASYVEARINVPRCDGCWPAFWLNPADDSWPPEIDVCEWGDTSRPERLRPDFNYHAASGKQGVIEYGDPYTDYRGGFHTFGLLWTATSVMPVLDGVPEPGVAATQDITATPMSLLLSLSVKAGHEPAEGARMLVDWVRVWVPTHSTPTLATAGPDAPWNLSLPTTGPVPVTSPSRRSPDGHS